MEHLNFFLQHDFELVNTLVDSCIIYTELTSFTTDKYNAIKKNNVLVSPQSLS